MLLLSVDWDFFFPEDEDWDWAHTESLNPKLDSILWSVRASNFVRAGTPLPGTSGKEDTFWPRFKFSPGAALHYADSHSKIYEPAVIEGITEVWNFDAHVDSFKSISEVYESKRVECDSWISALAPLGVHVRTFLPHWVKGERALKGHIRVQHDPEVGFHRTFDRIFVCRSGAWTPPWLEDRFWSFIDGCPVSKRVGLDHTEARKYDPGDVRRLAENEEAVINAFRTRARGEKSS